MRGIKGIKPGDEAHHKLVTASKISATLIPSRSPYESYFSLWHKMAGNIPWADLSESQPIREGNFLEPVLAEWFAGEHPEFNVRDPKSRVWLAKENPRFGATPDRIIEQGGYAVALLEIKTSRSSAGWGAEGTDQIPAHYFDQVQWQMYCTGVHKCYVQAQVFGSFKEYTVEFDEYHTQGLIRQAKHLLDTLEKDIQPDITDPDHMATYDAVRDLYGVDQDHQIKLQPKEAVKYLEAKEALDAAKKAYQREKTLLLGIAEDAHEITCAGYPIATRTETKTGTKILRHPRNLVTSHTLSELTIPKKNPFTRVVDTQRKAA